MKYTVAAILALGVAPVYSLSYLESLSGAAPSIRSAAPASAAEPPFFFTNGAKDEPAETPDFFFTSGSASAASATTSTGYLSALNGGGNAVSGAGMRSYLDSLPKNAPPNTGGGAGLRSYTDNLSPSVASARPAYTPAPAAPATPYVPSEAAAPVASGANYMDMLAKSSSAGAPTGAGMTSYLDALPRAAPARGGAGIQSYTDNLPVTNTVAGSGAGMNTYTDNLSGGRTSSGKAYTPFTSKPAAKSFGSAAATGRFEFTINANADMIAQIQAAGDRRVRLSGRANLN